MSLNFFVLGSTGLCGNAFFNFVNASKETAKIVTISRREPKVIGVKSEGCESILESDTKKWPELIEKIDLPSGSTMFSGFGTTRKNAGSAEKFIEIDHDINVDCFKAAKASNKFDTAILISSMGSKKGSMFLYMDVKGKIEQELKDLKFKRTIILKPGILLGERDGNFKGAGNTIAAKAGRWIKGTFAESLVGTPNTGEEISKCAFYLNSLPIKEEGEVIIVESADIVKYSKNI
ncbi:hypothetical protein CANARDRAFT_29605 [[Candida] arabinofermentans NRRL YB-2248]|uniref:NAD(P)-binding domain-containing protein n=1 Tax=[Candida] arabinofermentans NRRL YB-2248 TaxID=983967 RepID=A0A1E4SWM9_9ASCO|nr:hypothetical protein CANARDRAFT_29605 [[Candida] arabinofermentans NRRL YB-2248]